MPLSWFASLRFLPNRNGSISVMMAFAIVPLLLFVGVAVDYARLSGKRTLMQATLDTGIMVAAKAKEKGQANWQSIARSFVTSSLPSGTSSALSFQEAGNTISATLSVSYPLTISSLMGRHTMDIAVAATVKTETAAVGTCILLLSPSNGINMSGSAEIGPNCGIHVNGAGSGAINMSGTAKILSPALQVVGTINRVSTNVIDVAARTATVLADPLASLPEPPVSGGCNSVILSSGAPTSLAPQRYCTFIVSNRNITLQPGIHVFDGTFAISGTGSITGNNVLLYFTSNAKIAMSGTNTWTINAATIGTYSGVAIFLSRSGSNSINLSGSNNLQIGGVLYGPTASLNMSGTNLTTPMASDVAIILRTINMSNVTKLMINRPLAGCASSSILPAAVTSLCSSVSGGGTMRLVN
jgi:Flp pilus assembly protein TadG